MTDHSPIFDSPERTHFFSRSGLPFWDSYYVLPHMRKRVPYMLYTVKKQEPQLLHDMQQASVMVAKVFDKVLADIRSWQRHDLIEWGFDVGYYELFGIDWGKFFCLRIGWAIKDGGLKLMEVNSEKPTFWIETEVGNKLLSEHYGLQDPTPGTFDVLKRAVNGAIDESLQVLPLRQRVNARVGCVVRGNNAADFDTMCWLSTLLQYDAEVLTIDDLDFAKRTNRPVNLQTGNVLDALIFWYPLEYLVEMKFGNGERVLDVFVDGLKSCSFALVHSLSAFFIQPKSILAYITANENRIFDGELTSAKGMFPRTYLTADPLGVSYFAKPIWGREGRGCYAVRNGDIKRGRFQEDFFASQPHIYQELLDLPTVEIGGKQFAATYESWVYRVEGRFMPGGIGMRASENGITDDQSLCVPLGV